MPREFSARISRIRMKEGATVTVLPTREEPDRQLRAPLMRYARQLCDDPDFDGYILIGLFKDGNSNSGSSLPDRIPTTMATAYLTEILRRDALMAREAADVFDQKIEWVE